MNSNRRTVQVVPQRDVVATILLRLLTEYAMYQWFVTMIPIDEKMIHLRTQRTMSLDAYTGRIHKE